MSELGIEDNTGILNLSKGDGEMRKVVVTNISDEKMGGAFAKRKVEAGTKEQKMKLVLKSVLVGNRDCFGEESIEMNDAERYYERWKYLKEIGIPTVSSMRIVDKNHIAMGDMTHDGSEFFGKARGQNFDNERHGDVRPANEVEKKFLQIDPEEYKKEIDNILNRAWDAGVRLPHDDPSDLLVHPDGSWEVLVVDIMLLRRRKEEPFSSLTAERDLMIKNFGWLKNDLLKIISQK